MTHLQLITLILIVQHPPPPPKRAMKAPQALITDRSVKKEHSNRTRPSSHHGAALVVSRMPCHLAMSSFRTAATAWCCLTIVCPLQSANGVGRRWVHVCAAVSYPAVSLGCSTPLGSFHPRK